MSYSNIPNINPSITLEREDVINLLLASIAFEELGLSHIINSEAEKIQYILGTLPGHTPPVQATLDDLLKIDRAVDLVLRDVIQKEMILQFKMEDVLKISSTTFTSSTSTTTTQTTTETTTATTTETTTTATITETTTKTTTETTTSATTTETTTSADWKYSAWAQGLQYGPANAQYNEMIGYGQIKTPLSLGSIDFGEVILSREADIQGDILRLQITVLPIYMIDWVQLNIDTVKPPRKYDPEQFPSQFPGGHGNQFEITIDISSYKGVDISVAICVDVLR